MTDQEIVKGLIDRDQKITQEFFYGKCRLLFYSLINKIFDYEVDYDEFVNELYVYIMENDAARLRSFQYRSNIYKWIKVTAARYFREKRDRVIDDRSKEPPYVPEEPDVTVLDSPVAEKEDLERLFEKMPNKRYVYVIRRLIIEDCEPEELAKEMNITTANLYNIKKRAMAQLTSVALNDIKEYGR